jgi:hypothetical protein
MTTAPPLDPKAPGTTKRLLGLGVVAGPLYLALGLAQALLRDGFDLARHPLSLLAVGPGGWIQTLNFIITGLLVVGAALGLRRALRPRAGAGAWALGVFGISMLLAAVFPADPMDGFPPGTPAGVPQTMSTSGLLHFAVGAVGFLALAVSCFVVAPALRRRGSVQLARLSYAAGVVVIGGFLTPAVLPSSAGTAGIWLSVVAGFAWLAIVAAHLRTAVDQPGSGAARAL